MEQLQGNPVAPIAIPDELLHICNSEHTSKKKERSTSNCWARFNTIIVCTCLSDIMIFVITTCTILHSAHPTQPPPPSLPLPLPRCSPSTSLLRRRCLVQIGLRSSPLGGQREAVLLLHPLAATVDGQSSRLGWRSRGRGGLRWGKEQQGQSQAGGGRSAPVSVRRPALVRERAQPFFPPVRARGDAVEDRFFREREREMYANPRKTGEQFVMRLLITYGDTGAKGALKDDHVLASAKCQVSTKYPTNALINRPALISYIISMKIKNRAQLDAALSFLTNTVLRSLWCRCSTGEALNRRSRSSRAFAFSPSPLLTELLILFL
ncbi:uncharacterized protein LOC119280100 [Triticum dicoccoides]|uniref:uncharacterized protein LOC119280100 n=1 Tax=Triticum dicoccoides TaxID=85692 RepID=UPI00188EDECF|nr:uncharacterized protein LOC119280100 [Triticum dicoccoides]